MAFESKLKVRKRFAYLRLVAPLVAMLPLSLRFVLRHCGSDKESPHGHHYGETYHKALRHLKYRKIRVLEIGVGGYQNFAGGESLVAWACYFPFALVFGCDIVDKTVLSRGRIVVRVADQSSESDLNLIERDGPFDFIVDDGSHISAHQIFTFQHLFPKLNSGGMYVIEDVQTSYWEALGGKSVSDLQFQNTCVGYFSILARYVNHAEFSADENVDTSFLVLSKSTKRIQFEHNLILIERN